jgi:hypothetical protein
MDSKNLPNNQIAVTYDDIIYSKTLTAFNGVSDSVSAKIVVSVDPDGVLRQGTENFGGAVPSKIQIFTSNDDGKLSKAIEFDKSGRVITKQLWSVTTNPSGNPLVLMANTNDPGQGPTLNLRRSRGTWNQPKSVIKDDNIFRICWYAHDGQSYKEVSSIHSKIEGDVSLGTIPTSLSFKIFNKELGIPTDAVKINSDHSTSFHSLSSLNKEILPVKAPLGLLEVTDEIERNKIQNPKPGTMIFLVSLDTVQVYTKTQGWKSLF